MLPKSLGNSWFDYNVPAIHDKYSSCSVFSVTGTTIKQETCVRSFHLAVQLLNATKAIVAVVDKVISKLSYLVTSLYPLLLIYSQLVVWFDDQETSKYRQAFHSIA